MPLLHRPSRAAAQPACWHSPRSRSRCSRPRSSRPRSRSRTPTSSSPRPRTAARWQAAALLELLAAALLPLAIAGMVTTVRGRGGALATVGAVLGALGTLGMTLIGARHLFVYGLSGIDHAAALQAMDRMDNGAGAVALPLMFAAPFSLIVSTAALARAQVVPLWTAAGAFLFFVSDMLPIPGAEIVQALLGLVTFGTVAALGLRGADERSQKRGAERFGAAAHAVDA